MEDLKKKIVIHSFLFDRSMSAVSKNRVKTLKYKSILSKSLGLIKCLGFKKISLSVVQIIHHTPHVVYESFDKDMEFFSRTEFYGCCLKKSIVFPLFNIKLVVKLA